MRTTSSEAARQWSAERVVAVAREIRARAAAARLPVQCVDHPPEERRALAVGLLSQVIDSAAAAGSAPLLDLAAAAGAGRELWDAECESWIELPRPPELPRGRYVALRISGESMAPLMHSGDVVLVRLGPRLVRDSVIVARRPDDGYVVKRIGAVRRTAIELRSLNPEFAPITIPRSESLVVGTVVLRWEGGRRSATASRRPTASPPA
jgi:SOS-response transcriptional repressor LexA